MTYVRRAVTAGITGMVLAGVLAACTTDAEMEMADQANVPTEDLVGQSMTITHEIQEVLPGGVFTVGEEEIIVLTDDVPEGLNPGDEVEITGTVERQDVYNAEDFEDLQYATDDETAQDLVNRGEDLVLSSAVVKPVE